jgi:hydrogenase expression/formation protein HypC
MIRSRFTIINSLFTIGKEKIMCLGIPGQIVEFVDEANDIAKVEVSGVRRNISVALVRPEGIAVDDWVLVHVGFAMSKIDEEEAQETLRMLHSLGEAYEEELEMLTRSDIV